MAKRNTVRINMAILDGYLKAKKIHPKDFCEMQLGFTDGWYYGIRKNDGRGVKVLVAKRIANLIGVEYETLVIKDGEKAPDVSLLDFAEMGENNPSVNEVDSSLCTREPSAGASPRPTDAKEERGTGNPPLTVEEKADLLQMIEALKVEKRCLHAKLDKREDELEKVSEMLAVAERELKRGVIEIRLTDLLPIMFFDLLDKEVSVDYVTGYLNALRSIFTYDDIRKE